MISHHRIFGIFLFLAITCSWSVHADTTASSGQTRIVTIGDHFPHVLEVVVPRNTTVTFPRPDQLPSLIEVKSFQTSTVPVSQGQDDQRIEGRYILAVYDIGRFMIPTMTVIVHNNAKQDQVVFPSVPLEVRRVTPDAGDKNDIRDVKPPMTIPLTWKEIAALLAVLICIVAIVVVLFMYIRRRNSQKPVAEVIPVPPDPYLYAVKELDRIRQERMLEKDLYKEYYSAVSDTVRQYLKFQYNVDALETTTRELLSSLRELRLPWNDQEQLKGFFQNGDLVKFARYNPVWDEADDYIETAQAIIELLHSYYIKSKESVSSDTENNINLKV